MAESELFFPNPWVNYSLIDRFFPKRILGKDEIEPDLGFLWKPRQNDCIDIILYKAARHAFGFIAYALLMVKQCQYSQEHFDCLNRSKVIPMHIASFIKYIINIILIVVHYIKIRDASQNELTVYHTVIFHGMSQIILDIKDEEKLHRCRKRPREFSSQSYSISKEQTNIKYSISAELAKAIETEVGCEQSVVMSNEAIDLFEKRL